MPTARKAERKSDRLKVLIRRSAIEKRVREVARAITKDFKGQRVHLIGVLKGACIFFPISCAKSIWKPPSTSLPFRVTAKERNLRARCAC